jgi:hypothetical protein
LADFFCCNNGYIGRHFSNLLRVPGRSDNHLLKGRLLFLGQQGGRNRGEEDEGDDGEQAIVHENLLGPPEGPKMKIAEEKGLKKIPGLLSERLGILPASTLHSLILEDFSVKDIQTRFSDSPGLNSPSRPESDEGQWLFLLRHLPRMTWAGMTAAGPSPTLTGFPTPGYHQRESISF